MTETQFLYRYLSFADDTPYRRYIQVKRPNVKENGSPANASGAIEMTHGSYGALLFHPRWKIKRNEILARDMHRCFHCKGDKGLQVHHRQYHFIASQQKYRLPWEYPNHLLITLCESCHNRGHNKYKVPTINI
jgi:hypothetical protein